MKLNYFALLLFFAALITACTTNKITSGTTDAKESVNPEFKSEGGSSGMEQIDDHTYVAVYDLKVFRKGHRVGLIKIEEESLQVYPIAINDWGPEGDASDLEGISKIPGRTNEFLATESGNWQGKFGRIFHLKIDTSRLKGEVLGVSKLPMLALNDIDKVGDQYEAILCLPYTEGQRIVVLGERGGSGANRNGIIRWGTLDLNDHSFEMNDIGLKGIPVEVPGNWHNPQTKRSITDFHLDSEGGLWASASEDQGDLGPFFSAIYKLGQVKAGNPNQPVTVYESIHISKEVDGFKIEALSGPCKGIDSSHSFGTEDEIYGGVWRPILIED